MTTPEALYAAELARIVDADPPPYAEVVVNGKDDATAIERWTGNTELRESLYRRLLRELNAKVGFQKLVNHRLNFIPGEGERSKVRVQLIADLWRET